MNSRSTKNTIFAKAALACAALSLCALLCACSGGSQSSASSGGSDIGTTSGAALQNQTVPAASFSQKDSIDVGGAKLDVSHSKNGYVGVSGESNTRLKFEVAKDGLSMYYDMPSDGTPILAPLSMGDGNYTFNVWENTQDQRYAKLGTHAQNVSMTDEFQPFLVQNMFCDFDPDGDAARMAKSLTQDAANQGDALAAIYNWVVENVYYNTQKAESLSGKTGYIPDPDALVTERNGICFDYASLVAAMLRSQGIPCKIITGDVAPNDIYHAWNMVYIDGTWVNTYIDVASRTWTRLDTTFAASGADPSFVGDGSNYSERYTY